LKALSLYTKNRTGVLTSSVEPVLGKETLLSTEDDDDDDDAASATMVPSGLAV